MLIDAKSRRKTMTAVKAVFVPSKLGIATRFDHATGTRARTVTRFLPLVANHYGRLSSTTTCPLLYHLCSLQYPLHRTWARCLSLQPSLFPDDTYRHFVPHAMSTTTNPTTTTTTCKKRRIDALSVTQPDILNDTPRRHSVTHKKRKVEDEYQPSKS